MFRARLHRAPVRSLLAAMCTLAVLVPAAHGRPVARTPVAAGCPETSASYEGPCGPLFTTPQWSDQSGWSAPSAYETIALARLGGGSREDLIGRDSSGLWVEQFDAQKGQWQLLGSADGGVALPLPDRDGWNQPSQYRTIQTADLNGNGQAELLARAADGLHVYRWDPATATFTDISTPPRLFSDAAGGNQPSVYETIQTADLFGDGHAELVARTPQGIEYARWNQDTGQFVDVTQTGIAPDAHGGNDPSLYKTIHTGDLSGDGRADLLLLAGGLRWYAIQPDGHFAEQPPMLPGLDHQHGYGRPNQYETVRAVHIAGHKQELVLARATDGLHVYQLLDNKWSEAAPVLGDLSDAHGFDQPSEYRTIVAGDVTGHGRLDVVARTADGIAVWELHDGAWARLPSSGPELTGPVWEDPSHYDTIRLGDITGHGDGALVARGVFGVRTFTWQDGAFRRPQPYGDFPAFTGSEADAYADVGPLLLGREGDFRKLTYASPHEAITEATLNDYRARLAERCTPLAAKRTAGGPPRYTDCAPPPGSDVEPAAWTAVSNQIIAELWAAAGVVAHFTILDGIETKLFQDRQGTLPALDRELTLPANPPDRSPTYLKLTKASLDILKGVAEFFPGAGKIPHILRTIALTGNALGAVADGLGLRGSPAPPASYGQIVAEVAKLQQRERDITQAERRYVLADYGLLSVVGAEVKARLLTLDETAALSAGRQAFAMWVTQLYLPAYWARYQVTGCTRGTDLKPTPIITYVCDVPTGASARVTGHNGAFRDFHAVLVGGSYCHRGDHYEVVLITCFWSSVEGATFTRIISPVPPDCRYDPTPGSTAAWRYGCPYGVPAADLIDGTSGWNLPLVRCAANQGQCHAVSRVHSAPRSTPTAKPGRPGVLVRSGAIIRRPPLHHSAEYLQT
jgi:FG-GAP-like repeat